MKIFPGLFLFIAPAWLSGQTVDHAKELFYYERYNSSVNTLHKVLRVDADNTEAWYWLAQSYFELKKTGILKDSLRFIPQQISAEPACLVVKGQVLLHDSKKDSAGFYFTEAIKKTRGKDAFILSAVARAHIIEKMGDGNYAVELLKKAVKKDKQNASLYTLMGDAYRKLGNGTEAYKMYQQALHHNGSYAAAHYKLGKIFLSQKNNIYLKYFERAISADGKYAPVYYDLYYHYYFIAPQKALDYFNSYVGNSDPKTENDYLFADLLYLNKQYEQAIDKTNELINSKPDSVSRLYKLLAYAYAGMKDTSSAIQAMNQYFSKPADSFFLAKDYEFMADLYASTDNRKDSALFYYSKVLESEPDSAALIVYHKKLAELSKELKNYEAHAKWLGKYYESNKNASNLDLFNWGIAHFKAGQYTEADSVFALYTEKYPEQSYGYYWRARSNALLDSTMESGSAIPHYQELISIIEKDTSDATNKKWLIESYGYIAAYKTNKEKDFLDAIEYLEKVLVLDPENTNAREYIGMLEKSAEVKQEKN